MSNKNHPKPEHEAKKPAVQSFADLLSSNEPGKGLDRWNGMKVFVMDPVTNKVLINVGGDSPHDPASLTKLMTCYCVLDAVHSGKLRLEQTITVSANAAKQQYAKVIEGHTYTIDQLLGAAITASDNGATQALAESLGESFLNQMNAKGRELGLKHTRFVNPHGLPAKGEVVNTTTAHDITTLITRIHKDFPSEVKKYMQAESVTYFSKGKGTASQPAERIHKAHHWLNDGGSELSLPEGYTASAKTGYTERAGHNIASVIAAPDGRRLVVVVMGGKWSHQDAAIEAGVPTTLLAKKVKGNRVRDALVGDLVQEFLVKTTPHRAQALPALSAPVHTAVAPPPVAASVAPAASKPVAVQPLAVTPPAAVASCVDRTTKTDPKILAAAVTIHTAQKLTPDALKAVQECRRKINNYSRPGADCEAKVIIATTPKVLEEDLKKLEKAKPELATEEAKLAAALRKNPKAKPSDRLRKLRELEEAVQVDKDVLARLKAIEDQTNPAIYTRENYEKELASAKKYTDAFVDAWGGALPDGGKPVLKQKLRGVIEGAAGIETGWNPETVKSKANRGQFTGVFQTSWAYIADAKRAFDAQPAMKAVLDKNPTDAAVVNFLFPPELEATKRTAEQKKEDLERELTNVKGLPTTAFAGQGAIMGAMIAASYVRHVTGNGDVNKIYNPNNFSGQNVYQEHMLGAGNVSGLRNQLANTLTSNQKGASGISRKAHNENFIVTDAPYTNLNDLNPDRLTYDQATAADVAKMIRDKSIHAYNRAVNHSANPEKLAALELAYFPEWKTNPTLKAQDIARVTFQKELGRELRDVAEKTAEERLLAQVQKTHKKPSQEQVKHTKVEPLCNILRPMPKLEQAASMSRK